MVITGDRLQEAVDEAVKRGRMTREDAEELVQNLVEIGRRQTQDALAEIERLIGRSANQTRRIDALAREERRRRRAPRAGDRPRAARRSTACAAPPASAALPDHRLRRPHGRAGQGAPCRPQRRRAAQGPRPRAPQREPQVGPGGDRQAPAVARASNSARRHLSSGRMESSTFIAPREGRRARSADRRARLRRQRVARQEGYVVFVAGAIPGDLVRAVITKRKRAYAEARTLRGPRAQPRAHRAARRPSRRALAGAALRAPAGDQARAGPGRADADRPSRGLRARRDRPRRRAVALPQQARVLVRHRRRRRARLRLPRARLLARHRRRSSDCLLASERSNAVREQVLAWCRAQGRRAFDRRTHTGLLRNLVVREGRRTGQIQVRLVTGPGELDGTSLAEAVDCEGLSWTTHRRARRDDAGRRDAEARRANAARGGALRPALLDLAERVLSDEHRDGRAALRDRRRARRPARAGSASTTCTAGSARSG